MSEILNPGPSRESQGPSPSGTLFRTRREVADLSDRATVSRSAGIARTAMTCYR